MREEHVINFLELGQCQMRHSCTRVYQHVSVNQHRSGLQGAADSAAAAKNSQLHACSTLPRSGKHQARTRPVDYAAIAQCVE